MEYIDPNISEEDFCREIESPTTKELYERLGVNGDPGYPRKKIIDSFHPYNLFRRLIEMGHPHNEVMYASARTAPTLRELVEFMNSRPQNS